MRNVILAFMLAVAAAIGVSLTPAVAAQKKTQSQASAWDGTWSGMSSAGGRTTVKIAGGKVTYWTNNGFARPKATGTAKGNSVSLDDNNGWKATMTMQGESKARITAAGMGNNGKPAKNTAVLTKR
ncbi:hypothetical protein [Rhizobium sp. SSA_523]|uniref:hypothetical protein n=1 Tax=Rhizobium sp. SSA_523 TaxID=2952477 RepID=UPI0020912143|nr:hypothetical protein [Rhizobium sp. SSA_523]MCO5734808.1 hypothetical protein [Rhizobium sp. SSA_523]WKC21053.1 hypothetical protein QTJ18_01095 [Rhizobium sp. SSA_523]